MKKKYKVTISETYNVYRSVEVEANSSQEAEKIAYDQTDEHSFDVSDYEFSDCEVIEVLEVI